MNWVVEGKWGELVNKDHNFTKRIGLTFPNSLIRGRDKYQMERGGKKAGFG